MFKEEIEQAILIREVETKLLELFSKGKLNGTVHTCVGQEFSGVFVSKFLKSEDFVVSNHRGHGHYIARTGDIYGLFAEIMSKKDGCSGGIGGSQHFYNTNYLSNGIQGGMVSIAAGVALSGSYFKKDSVSVAFIGDGTLGQGSLYEAMHISSILALPLVIVVENNHYSQSTSHNQNFSGSIKARAKGFGFEYFYCSTFNLDSMEENISTAIDYARSNKLPVLIEVDTYRLNAHSKGDDNRFQKEINDNLEKDVISRFKNESEEQYKEIIKKHSTLINGVLLKLESSEVLHAARGREERIGYSKYDTLNIDRTPDNLKDRVNQLIYESLANALKNNSTAFLIGEDIQYKSQYTEKSYGGAFNVTQNLSELFPNRVLSTSISESAMTGLATGLAIKGHLAIVEIMFGDFTTLIIDQLQQHACKFYEMYNRKFSVPLIIRTPMGGGRGYGPTHSQSLEGMFNGIAGLDILALNNRIPPGKVYKALSESIVRPTLVIENKVLYTQKINNSVVSGYNIKLSNDGLYDTIIYSPKDCKADVTIFCYGGVLSVVEKAIERLHIEYEIRVEVICPVKIKPIDPSQSIDSVKRTHALVTIEEGSAVGGVGAELISIVSEYVDNFKIKRISNDKLIPCSIEAENLLLPSDDSIVNGVRSFLV